MRGLQAAHRRSAAGPARMARQPRVEVRGHAGSRVPCARIEPRIQGSEFGPKPRQSDERVVAGSAGDWYRPRLASGETVVLEVTWRGTHTGPLQTPRGPLAPTGRRIELRACMALEVAGDRVRVQRQYFDMATMMEQLGQTT